MLFTSQARPAGSVASPSRRVLLSAYACEPGKGSEPGAGWLWALAAARTAEVWVLTRANNRTAIEADPAGTLPSLHFVYLDLPPSVLRWKRDGQWVRMYYLLWQFLAARTARRLHARTPFDVVHHVTFANLWLPALAGIVDAPFVLGPVSGGQRVALAHYPALGVAGIAKEITLRAVRPMLRVTPLIRLAWRRATLILVNNAETADALPRAFRQKASIRPAQCAESAEQAAPTDATAPPVAVYAGRLHRFKGVELALRALALLPHWRLIVVGSGPDEARLRALARQLGIAERIEWRGQLPQERLWKVFAECDLFLLPSLKEGGGFAAFEAAARGLPVVAFAAGGPAAVADRYRAARFELVPPDKSFTGLAEAVARVGKRGRSAPGLEGGVEALAADLEAIYDAAQRATAGRTDLETAREVFDA